MGTAVYQTFGRILSEEGWRGLYAGMAPAFIGSVASHTLYFGIYEATKRRLLEHDVDPAVAYFMAGKYYNLFPA